MKYVLVTSARNEEALIANTLDSVCSQSVLPERWVIVDDGSTDGTADVVRRYADRYRWIELIQQSTSHERSFAAKARAFGVARARLQSIAYDVIGNIDADVSFDSDYMRFLIGVFERDSNLGVAGTPFVEKGYDSARDSFEGAKHVAGGVQLFRRQCLDQIGGYVPNNLGGIDWIAVTTARMKGWTTRSFAEKRFTHWRSLGTASRGRLSAQFAHGKKDYYLGGSPIWQLCRVGFRVFKQPFILGGVALALGYSWAALRRMPLAVSPQLMRFHRAEQWAKLRIIGDGLLRFRKVGPGYLTAADPRL